MISKSTIAETLGLTDEDLITDSVFAWAKAQFFAKTGLNESETSRTFKKMFNAGKEWVKLGYRNISSIDAIRIDGEEQDFTLYETLRFNPDSGLLHFTNGFTGYTEIDVTLAEYDHTDLHDYLVSLYAYLGMLTFTPDIIGHVKKLVIGDFEKEYFQTGNSKEGVSGIVLAEVERVMGLLNGDDGIAMGEIL